MNAVLLVGGRGTRLMPLTARLPKPLIPVVNQPLIAHLIKNLRNHGVTNVVLAASSSDRRIERVLGDGSRMGVSLTYSYEKEPLGSGLAVKQAAANMDGPFFVCNGDIITDLDLTDMAKRHREHGAILSIALSAVEDPSAYGVVQLEDDDRIVTFVEKPPPDKAPSSWANAGTWIFERELLDYIPDVRLDGSLERRVFPKLIDRGELVHGFPSMAYWMDVGTPQRYLQVHQDLLAGRLLGMCDSSPLGAPDIGPGCQIGQNVEMAPDVVVGRGSVIGDGARLGGGTILGERCVVGAEASIEGSVLWTSVEVGAGAVIVQSIIGDGCKVGRHSIVDGGVLGDGVEVGSGVHLPRGTRREASA